MSTTVVPGPDEDLGQVAGKLIAAAEKLGLPARVVKVSHDPRPVFVVPDELADAYSSEQEAAAPPKRRRKAAADEPAGDEGKAEGGSKDA